MNNANLPRNNMHQENRKYKMAWPSYLTSAEEVSPTQAVKVRGEVATCWQEHE